MSPKSIHKKLSDFELKSIITSTTDLILVLFTSNGSGLGYIEESNLAELPKRLVKSLSIYKIEYEKNIEAAWAYNIQELPTLLFFHRESIIDKIVGLQTKEDLIAKIQLNLEKYYAPWVDQL